MVHDQSYPESVAVVTCPCCGAQHVVSKLPIDCPNCHWTIGAPRASQPAAPTGGEVDPVAWRWKPRRSRNWVICDVLPEFTDDADVIKEPLYAAAMAQSSSDGQFAGGMQMSATEGAITRRPAHPMDTISGGPIGPSETAMAQSSECCKGLAPASDCRCEIERRAAGHPPYQRSSAGTVDAEAIAELHYNRVRDRTTKLHGEPIMPLWQNAKSSARQNQIEDATAIIAAVRGAAQRTVDLDDDMKEHGSYRDALIEECAKIAEGTAPVASGNFFTARRDQCAKIAAKIRTLSITSTHRPLCSCKASARDGQHMAWCASLTSTHGAPSDAQFNADMADDAAMTSPDREGAGK